LLYLHVERAGAKSTAPPNFFFRELERRFRPIATFCLVHGKWHDGSCWNLLADALKARGHETVAPNLPLHDGTTSYEQRVQPAVAALGGAPDPVVVVGHSLAAVYAPLVAVSRRESLLVYLCPAPAGPLARSGAPMNAGREGFPFPPNRPDGTSVWEPQAAIDAMYPRLPDEMARAAAGNLHPAAPAAGAYPLAGQPDVRTALVYATEDEFFEPAWERWVARERLGVEPIEMPCGHFPMLECPDALADVLSGLAAE
jgi:pimeloyl-ACP methyl ester carboxylesterase